MNVRQLMKQAQQMQEKLQQELEELEVEASVGGGMVEVKMNGNKRLLAIKIDPEVLDPEDPAMLQDLVLAAVTGARRVLDLRRKPIRGSNGCGSRQCCWSPRHR